MPEVLSFDPSLDRDRLHGVALGSAGDLGRGDFSFTVEVWVRIGAGAGAAELPVVATVPGERETDGSLFLGIQGRRVRMGTSPTNGIIGNRELREERWYHLAWQYADGVQSVFVNGVRDGFNRAPLVFESQGRKLLLGIVPTSEDEESSRALFNGRLAELRAWGRALGESGIRARWTRRVGGDDSGLLGHFPLDDLDSGLTERLSGEPREVVGDLKSIDDDTLPLFESGTVEGFVFGPDRPGSFEVPSLRQAIPPGTAKFAIEAWVRPASLASASYRAPIVSQHGPLSGWELRAGERAGLMLSNGRGYTDLNSTTTLQPDVWQHLLGVYDGVAMTLYVNGVRDTTQPFDGPPAWFDGPLSIGVNPNFAGRVFHGAIGLIRLWTGTRFEAATLAGSTMWHGVEEADGLEAQLWLHAIEAMPEELREAAFERGLTIAPLLAPPPASERADEPITIVPAIIEVEVEPIGGTPPGRTERDRLMVEFELARGRIEQLERELERQRRVAEELRGEREASEIDIELDDDETTLAEFIARTRRDIERARDEIGASAGSYRLGRVAVQVRVLPGAKGKTIRFPDRERSGIGEMLTTIDLEFEAAATVEPAPVRPKVPDVLGYTETEARRQLVGAGFTVETGFQNVAAATEVDRVIEQYPVEGLPLEPGASVMIFIGKDS